VVRGVLLATEDDDPCLEDFAMRRLLIGLLLAAALAAVSALPVAAQAEPCNDTSGDGAASGLEYAQFHVTALAHEGLLGHVHKPGEHQGFSLCLDVHG
jgi:hypothetical protein